MPLGGRKFTPLYSQPPILAYPDVSGVDEAELLLSINVTLFSRSSHKGHRLLCVTRDDLTPNDFPLKIVTTKGIQGMRIPLFRLCLTFLELL